MGAGLPERQHASLIHRSHSSHGRTPFCLHAVTPLMPGPHAWPSGQLQHHLHASASPCVTFL